MLGLTATPSRHDNKPLEFDRESFLYWLPRPGTLRNGATPNVIELEGVTAEISDFSDQQLNTLNTEDRNAIIVQALLKHRDIAKEGNRICRDPPTC